MPVGEIRAGLLMGAALVLVALVVLAAAGRRLGWWGAVSLAGVSLLWLLLNAPMEGAVLVHFTDAHGLTAADLAGFAGLLIAGWRLRRSQA